MSGSVTDFVFRSFLFVFVILHVCIDVAPCESMHDRKFLAYVNCLQHLEILYEMSLVVRKPVFGVSDQVRHKAGCTATEDGQMLDI